MGITSLAKTHMDLAVEHADVEFDPYVNALLAEAQEVSHNSDRTDASSLDMVSTISPSASSSRST
jgi:hypothetical protein